MIRKVNKSAKKKVVAKKTAKANKKEAKQLITKKMLIGEIASKYPKSVPVMFKNGMHCIGCGMTAYETLEQGCMAHGMNAEEIDAMVDEMNKEVAKK